MATAKDTYPVSFSIDYQEEHDRVTSFFRLFWSIPILIVLSALSSSGFGFISSQETEAAASGGGSVLAGLSAATALMIVFRQKYPRWWFDFALELNRFSARVCAYLFLLSDRYPSTDDKQSVHLVVEYPDAKKDLNRWMPLVKWFLAIPHIVVLAFLIVCAILATIAAWFSILFTGRYPKSLFDYVEGVARWGTRVNAYAFLLTTDKYPPFSLS
jgi:Domain of unknown function (DUF4389)